MNSIKKLKDSKKNSKKRNNYSGYIFIFSFLIGIIFFIISGFIRGQYQQWGDANAQHAYDSVIHAAPTFEIGFWFIATSLISGIIYANSIDRT